MKLELLDDRTVGEGGFLQLRRLRLRVVREDGTRTGEGLYDFVERPMGLDAVVLLLWSRTPDGVEVLLRQGLRVPLRFGRGQDAEHAPALFTELVAGIIESQDTDLRERARAEALEEAGLSVDASAIKQLGPPMFPTPGMCAELFHLFSCEVNDSQRSAAVSPEGDGSPFEEGARTAWVPLDEALARCARGEIQDLKTELMLRRLREQLQLK